MTKMCKASAKQEDEMEHEMQDESKLRSRQIKIKQACRAAWSGSGEAAEGRGSSRCPTGALLQSWRCGCEEIISVKSKTDDNGYRYDTVEFAYQWKFDEAMAR